MTKCLTLRVSSLEDDVCLAIICSSLPGASDMPFSPFDACKKESTALTGLLRNIAQFCSGQMLVEALTR